MNQDILANESFKGKISGIKIKGISCALPITITSMTGAQ